MVINISIRAFCSAEKRNVLPEKVISAYWTKINEKTCDFHLVIRLKTELSPTVLSYAKPSKIFSNIPNTLVCWNAIYN